MAFWPPMFIGNMSVLTNAWSQSWRKPPLPLLRLLISMRSGSNSTCCASSSSRDISNFCIFLTPSPASALHSERIVLLPRRVPQPPNGLDLELFLTFLKKTAQARRGTFFPATLFPYCPLARKVHFTKRSGGRSKRASSPVRCVLAGEVCVKATHSKPLAP